MSDDDFAPIGPNSLVGTPDQHFDTLLYVDAYSAGSPNRVGGLNFKPDLVWIKCREGSESHSLIDSVRGAGKRIIADSNAVEGAVGTGPKEFTEDGFFGGTGYGSDGDGTGHDFVAWCWKAGNGTTRNNDGSIESIVSVNQDAGFSIITSTTRNVEPNDMTETFGHGLTKAPEFIMQKQLDVVANWNCFFPLETTTNLKGLVLNGTGAVFTNGSYKTFEITDSLIKIGRQAVENNNKRFVVYAWHSVEGYSKIGSYKGNGNAAGPFVYLGFKPAWVMRKRTTTTTGHWQIVDNRREGFNGAGSNDVLFPNTTSAEGDADRIDLLSNGFRIRTTDGDVNGNGETYFYMAFAEMPFKYATAR
jgi:hypothetical protein